MVQPIAGSSVLLVVAVAAGHDGQLRRLHAGSRATPAHVALPEASILPAAHDHLSRNANQATSTLPDAAHHPLHACVTCIGVFLHCDGCLLHRADGQSIYLSNDCSRCRQTFSIL